MPSSQAKFALQTQDILGHIGGFLDPTSCATAAGVSKSFFQMAHEAPEKTWFCNDRATHALAAELLNHDLIRIETKYMRDQAHHLMRKKVDSSQVLALINTGRIGLREADIQYTDKLYEYCESNPDFARRLVDNPLFSRFLTKKTFEEKLDECLLLAVNALLVFYVGIVDHIFKNSIQWVFGGLVYPSMGIYTYLREEVELSETKSTFATAGLSIVITPILVALAVPAAVCLGVYNMLGNFLHFCWDIGKRIVNSDITKNKITWDDIQSNVFGPNASLFALSRNHAFFRELGGLTKAALTALAKNAPKKPKPLSLIELENAKKNEEKAANSFRETFASIKEFETPVPAAKKPDALPTTPVQSTPAAKKPDALPTTPVQSTPSSTLSVTVQLKSVTSDHKHIVGAPVVNAPPAEKPVSSATRLASLPMKEIYTELFTKHLPLKVSLGDEIPKPRKAAGSSATRRAR